MKEIDPPAGCTIDRACTQLAAEAPAFMVFNDTRVEAKPGDTPEELCQRWAKDRIEQQNPTAACIDCGKSVSIYRCIICGDKEMHEVAKVVNENNAQLLEASCSWGNARNVAKMAEIIRSQGTEPTQRSIELMRKMVQKWDEEHPCACGVCPECLGEEQPLTALDLRCCDKCHLCLAHTAAVDARRTP